MRRRPGVTLIEVLVAIFITGIGMLALLALFPLGAVSMAQALRDDRTASAAVVAENTALAFDIRHDPLVVAGFTTGTASGPSNPVYADPWGVLGGGGGIPGANGTSIIRANLSFGGAAGGAQRWCTLLDDITFVQNGTADLSATYLQRAGWYTWAYMLQRPNAATDAVVNLSIVVYQKRPIGLAPNEYPYQVPYPLDGNGLPAGVIGTNSVTLIWNPATQPQPAIRRNSWLLDMSDLSSTGAHTSIAHGDFYRVINVTELGSNQVRVELEKNLKQNTDAMTVMQDVVDVFDKGPSWQP
ncbi:MAG TPA: prepilin-type N-terminal cleavage/methylation domain-containing protein [Gemmataceae bacterium]